jgi:hypothetical protein
MYSQYRKYLFEEDLQATDTFDSSWVYKVLDMNVELA